jgi:hypothetical protein
MLARGPIFFGERYFGIHWVALATMSTLIGLSAILLGTLAKVAIATYHPFCDGRMVPWLARTQPVEWLVFAGCALAASGFLADVYLLLHWLTVGGAMENSAHIAFLITTLGVAGVTMALTGFVLKLLLDNLVDVRG